MRDKVLVIGHAGMLGKDIIEVFKKDNFDVFGIDLFQNPNLDEKNQWIGNITNTNFLLNTLNAIEPNIIIYCAAIVNLQICEENKNKADEIHSVIPAFIINNFKKPHKFIYISTDSVFDGKKGNYCENDQTNPLNYYSLSKLKGEKEVLKFSNSLVIRTNIYGFNNPLKNSLAEWAIKSVRNKIEISGFDDVIFNAIFTKDLAKIIYQIFDKEIRGVYHIACPGKWSKYEFLKKLLTHLNYNLKYLKKGKSKDINFKIQRPEKTDLNINKINNIIKLPGLEESLNNFCSEFKNQIP